MVDIDHKRCDKCGACICVCRRNAIMLNVKLIIFTDTCIGCGMCVNICPLGALTPREKKLCLSK